MLPCLFILTLSLVIVDSLKFLAVQRERYRDLIDAADTVTEMKTCAGQVGNMLFYLEECL